MVKSLLIVATLSVVALMSVVTLRKSVMDVSATGQRFDHLGPRIKCQVCLDNNAVSVCRSGYEYHCEKCGADYRARWNSQEKTIELNW
jgi:hypothetical protein